MIAGFEREQDRKGGTPPGRLSGFGALFQERRKDLVALLILSLVLVLVFSKTIFFGQAISRVGLVAARDVVFRSFCTGPVPVYDESVFLLLAPYYFLVSSYWSLGQIPLWNPYSGWGAPLLGDVQSAALSPWRILFSLSPNMETFNLFLVAEVLLALVGMYMLARSLRLTRYSAIFAAVTYAFCPYTLHYLELLSGTSSAMMPVLFCLFVRLARNPSVLSIIWAALGCTVFIFSGHPESSFLGVMFASLLMIIVYATSAGRDLSLKERVTRPLLILSLTGFITFCLTAPLLFSFAEFVMNADCYKFGTTKNSVPSWQGIAYNLMQPAYQGASPFLGCLALPLILVAWASAGTRKMLLCLMAAAATAFVIMCRPGIFGALLMSTPLNMVPGSYCGPVLIMLLALAASLGLEGLAADDGRGGKKKLFSFACGAALILAIPLLLNWAGFDVGAASYDSCLPPMVFLPRDWINNALLLSVALIACLVLLRGRLPRLVLVSLFLSLSFLSEAAPARLSLPSQPKFAYQKADPIPFLAEKKERILALGFDVLSPNNHFVFRIPSIGVHNVMVPRRYLSFMSAMGANLTLFNTVVDKVPLSRLIDIAGVKYIVSLAPVVGEADTPVPETESKIVRPIAFNGAPDLHLKKATIGYDEFKSEVWGHLDWSVGAQHRSRYVYSIVVMDESGNTLWYGGLHAIAARSRAHAGGRKPESDGRLIHSRTRLTGLIPQSIPETRRFQVGLQVFDSKTSSFLIPESADCPVFQSVVAIKDFACRKPAVEGGVAKAHFRLVSESLPQFIRVYENQWAVPSAFIAGRALSVATGEEALAAIGSANFNPYDVVILEGRAKNQPAANESMSWHRHHPPDSATVGRPSPQEVTVDAFSHDGGYLVLTDLYFPGWRATVDGRPAEILRANYMFRAVELPPGRHQVRFVYAPFPFFLGVVIAFSAFAACAFLIARELLIKWKSVKKGGNGAQSAQDPGLTEVAPVESASQKQ